MIALLKFLFRNIVTIAVLAIGIVVGGLAIGKWNEVRFFLFPETEVTVSRPIVVVNQIKAIAQLVTVSSEIGTTNIEVEIHQGFLNSGYYRANHIAIGAIDAGIDFEKITKDAIELRNDTYTITLPAPEITSCRIEYIDQNQHSLTLLAADWDMVRQIAQAEALDQFARSMISGENDENKKSILERAAEEAEFRIGVFVENLTGLKSIFRFEDADGEPQLPDSCKPISPDGWVKGDDGWRRAS